MQQITIQELYKNWTFYNPHYNFWYENQEIKSIHATADYKYYAAYTYDDKRILVLNDDLIEAVPKTAHPTELQDPSDLDATLPIDPRETAQRDYDEIQRLLAENAKMRDCIQSVINKALEISENEDYSKEQISIKFAIVGMDCIKLLKELDQ